MGPRRGAGFWILAGAGLALLIRVGTGGGPRNGARRIFHGWACVLFALLAASVLVQNRGGFTAVASDRAPRVRAAMRHLKSAAHPGDHLVCLTPTAGAVYYYHLRRKMDCWLWLLLDETVPPDILHDGHALYWIIQAEESLTIDNVL